MPDNGENKRIVLKAKKKYWKNNRRNMMWTYFQYCYNRTPQIYSKIVILISSWCFIT